MASSCGLLGIFLSLWDCDLHHSLFFDRVYVKLAVVFKALFFHGGTSPLFGTWEWCHYRILRRHMVFVSKELETFLIKMASKHRSFHTVIHIFIERVSLREIVY